MPQEIIIPFTWKGWDSQDTLCNTYYEVTFKENFGVVKQGETFESITVDYGAGVIQINDDNNKRIINFIAKPIKA